MGEARCLKMGCCVFRVACWLLNTTRNTQHAPPFTKTHAYFHYCLLLMINDTLEGIGNGRGVAYHRW